MRRGGERFRIWGVNLTGWTHGSTNLPPKELAPLWAAELARFGINCVRFHFLDLTTRDPNDNSPRRRPAGLIDRHRKDTQAFDPDQIDRLDFFVAELKKRGIYSDLNLNVGRTYKEGDGVPDWDQIAHAKGMTYIGDRLLELQRDYARQLLTHYNPYTKSEYCHEPAVAIVEIVNENSIVEFWLRNWLRGERKPENPHYMLDLTPYYEQRLAEKYNAWLKQTKSPQQLAQLCEQAGVEPGAPIPRLHREEFRDAPRERFHAEATFYMEMEKQFFLGMEDYLKKDLGVESLVIGTADHTYWLPNQPLLRSTSLMDIVDGHVYWQHPAIWNTRNTPMVNEPLRSTIVKLSRSACAGKPYTVSEVNHPNPNEYACEMIPILAAYAAFQDWDGIFFYTFEPKVGDDFQPFVVDPFDIMLDPVKMVQMAAGALLFARPDVQPARETVLRSYSADQLIESMRLPEAERPYFSPGFPLSIPLRHESRIRCLDCQPTGEFASPGGPPYVSDTGELAWHVSQGKGGLVTIDTPRTQALVGFVRANGKSTSQLSAEVKNDFCAITVSSLDSKPLSFSSTLLLTACADRKHGHEMERAAHTVGRVGQWADVDRAGHRLADAPRTGGSDRSAIGAAGRRRSAARAAYSRRQARRRLGDPARRPADHVLPDSCAAFGRRRRSLVREMSDRPMKSEHPICRYSARWSAFLAVVVVGVCPTQAPAAGDPPAAQQLGRIQAKRLEEVSGIAASRQNPHILWMHNDGDARQLYAVHTSGQVVARLQLPTHVTDLEDIAIGPGPTPGVDYLYLGDIGDNEEDHDEVRVLRLAEPRLSSGGPIELEAGRIEQLRLTYPGGSYDAEALLVDPLTGDLFIVSKERKRARVFRARAESWSNDAVTRLEPMGKLKVKYISGGDVSRDGKYVLLRRESRGWLWSRQAGESLEAALAGSPRKVAVRIEGQSLNGESVAFSPDGSGYYTVSEGRNEPIGWFPLEPNARQ